MIPLGKYASRWILILLLFQPFFMSVSRANEGANIGIPLDTVGEFEDTIRRVAFWNEDLARERFPDKVPSGRLLELPVDTNEVGDKSLKGVGWLAVRLHVPDSLVGERFFFSLSQYGASELYIDSLSIGSIGRVASDPDQEKRRYKRFLFPYQHVFRNGGEHLLLCRFSDQTWEEERESYGKRTYGVRWMNFEQASEAFSLIGFFEILLGLGGLGGFLFALGLIHLLIFLFYPKKRGNFYYVIFIWLMAFTLAYGNTGFSEDPVHHLQRPIIFTYLSHLLTFSLMTLLYVFLRKERFGVLYWVLLLGGIAFIFMCELGAIGNRLTSFLLIPVVFIECLRVIFISLYRKVQGSWILGIGAGLFIALPLGIFLQGIFFEADYHFTGWTPLFVISIWLVLIPISMSIYLAHDFATTSKGLERKLVEVEELNQKNLEQEHEKQRILEEKKEELEEKVKERTAELQERKEEIEDAHREITDSINYAQRIQEAVLPEEERYSVLPENFILFQPRDPVSGDFHWGKQEGDHFYLAAVDCTGHGVPGGFMSMLGVSFLNEIMANEKDLKPGEILSRLKERVVNELSGTQGVQAKDGMDMAMLKIPNPKSQSPKGEEVEVEFAGAQNPLYLIREGVAEDPPVLEVYRNGEEVDEKVSKPFRDSSDGLEIQADKAGIGSEEHGVEHFRTVSFKVQKGDALYIFSDGYADQFGGPKGKKFRYGAFKRVLTELQDRSMEDQKRELGKQFEEWKGDQEQVDDVLVMGVRL